VKYTIKDGIVYDARKLLADVAAMVARAKAGPAPTAGAADDDDDALDEAH
jgi:hypothetical protein